MIANIEFHLPLL